MHTYCVSGNESTLRAWNLGGMFLRYSQKFSPQISLILHTVLLKQVVQTIRKISSILLIYVIKEGASDSAPILPRTVPVV